MCTRLLIMRQFRGMQMNCQSQSCLTSNMTRIENAPDGRRNLPGRFQDFAMCRVQMLHVMHMECQMLINVICVPLKDFEYCFLILSFVFPL